MIKRGKKAQTVFGMSFGMIFSIFIIAVIIAVAFFSISYFLNLNKCANIGLFYKSLQDEIDTAWVSGTYAQTFEGELPSKIETVCFGEVVQGRTINDPDNQPFYDDIASLKYNPVEGANVFLYPPKEACDGDFFSKKLKHAVIEDVSSFFCVKAGASKNPSVLLKFRDTQDTAVRISKTN